MWERQRFVVIVGQRRAMAIAVRNGSGLGLHDRVCHLPLALISTISFRVRVSATKPGLAARALYAELARAGLHAEQHVGLVAAVEGFSAKALEHGGAALHFEQRPGGHQRGDADRGARICGSGQELSPRDCAKRRALPHCFFFFFKNNNATPPRSAAQSRARMCRDRSEIELRDARHVVLDFNRAAELLFDHFDIEGLRCLGLFHNRFAPDPAGWKSFIPDGRQPVL